MKKYTLTVAALAAVMTLSLMPSCKKDDDNNNSRSAMIIGTWKATEEGEDANKNGVWDSNEHGPVSSNSPFGSLTFNSGGAGTANATVNGTSASVPINWALLNNDNDLRIIIDFFGKDTAYTNIVSLSGSELVTKDTTDGTTTFTLAKKQ